MPVGSRRWWIRAESETKRIQLVANFGRKILASLVEFLE